MAVSSSAASARTSGIVGDGRSGFERFAGRHAPSGWTEGLGATVVIDEGTGRCTGDAESRLRQADLGTGDLGTLVHPRFHGRGWAAARGRLCDRAFTAFGLRRIESQTFVGHDASRRMLERIGFVMKGTLRSHAILDWIPIDRWIATLLLADRDWGADKRAATVRGVQPASSTQQGPTARA